MSVVLSASFFTGNQGTFLSTAAYINNYIIKYSLHKVTSSNCIMIGVPLVMIIINIKANWLLIPLLTHANSHGTIYNAKFGRDSTAIQNKNNYFIAYSLSKAFPTSVTIIIEHQRPLAAETSPHMRVI